MVTDSLVKKKFVHETLQAGILKIYSTQENVVRNHYKRRTGRLLTTLSAHSFDSQISGENRTIFVRILPYLRFLDMHASATTASASSSAGTLHSTTVWYGACSITRRSLSSVMASRMRYAKASVRNWKSHSTLKNHKLWQVNI